MKSIFVEDVLEVFKLYKSVRHPNTSMPRRYYMVPTVKANCSTSRSVTGAWRLSRDAGADSTPGVRTTASTVPEVNFVNFMIKSK